MYTFEFLKIIRIFGKKKRVMMVDGYKEIVELFVK